MLHYLNVCDIKGGTVPPVDIITFGSPCQDLSVAGKRAGLKHEANGDDETTRSGLFMEAVRIIKEMRESTNGKYPTYALWENVPGAFSSNKGEDFRIVLEELAKIADKTVSVPMPPKGKWTTAGYMDGDGWSLAWRTVDAQYHGVPQRRRRILLVADFAGKRAGEVSSTIGVNCGLGSGRNGVIERRGRRLDAITIEPGIAQREGGHIYEGVSGTLRAEPGDNRMAVAYGFCPEQSAKTRGDGSAAEQAPTLRAGATPGVAYALQGSMVGRSDQNGPQGDGVNEDKCFTLNTIDRHAVAYGISSYASNAMMSDNPNSGIYEADTSRTLDLNGGNPACNQGGIVIVEPVVFRKTAHPRNADEGQGWEQTETHDTLNVFDNGETRTPVLAVEPIIFEPRSQDGVPRIHGNISPTLNTAQGGQRQPCIAEPISYGIDRASFNQGKNAKFDFQILEEQQPTLTARGPCLMARDYKDPNVVAFGDGVRYIVRLLTPTECARLQGFPDWWGHVRHKTDMTDDEVTFWNDVYITHQIIVKGKDSDTIKPKTKDQLLTWYNKLWSDGAEYKMWGNGVALPCVRVPIHNMAKHGAKTLASLFDGSGGFPLAGVLEGIEPVWCSEIEPYPIAVTVERLPKTVRVEEDEDDWMD